jgi:hypothetical protein
MEDFEEDERREKEQKATVEFFSEDGHGEAGFCDGIPGTLIQMFHFDCAQSSKIDVLQHFANYQCSEEEHVCEDE